MRETRKDKREPCVTAKFHSLLHKQLEGAGAPEKLCNFVQFTVFSKVSDQSPFHLIRNSAGEYEDEPS
jgi:hypothetical protein